MASKAHAWLPRAWEKTLTRVGVVSFAWWQVREASLDLAYIDARHDYDGVSEDLAAWWPKICPGGLLAGHDFDEGAVARAVRHFLLRAAPDATLVVTSDHPASWLFFRPPRPC